MAMLIGQRVTRQDSGPVSVGTLLTVDGIKVHLATVVAWLPEGDHQQQPILAYKDKVS
jgi:hypothetical protein